MATLLSDKIIFKIRNKDHFKIIRGLIHQEDIPILRKKMHLRIESKHKAKIDNIEGRYSPTIIVGDVTILLSILVKIPKLQINIEREDLNNTMS